MDLNSYSGKLNYQMAQSTRSRSRFAISGFTMIELLLVILIIGSLSASALPNLLDLRKDAYAATLRRTLGMIRTAMKTQMQQALVRCGRTLQQIQSQNFAGDFGDTAMVRNNITATGTGFFTPSICTAAQVVNAAERQFWTIGSGEIAHGFTGLTDAGTNYGGSASFLPKNPLVTPVAGQTTSVWFSTTVGPTPTSGCTYVNFGGNQYHWIFLAASDGPYIFPGTNTAGINECAW